MSKAVGRFTTFVNLQRRRNAKRLRFTLLMAAVIGVLLWQTQWLILRPGLAILLAGWLGTAVSLMLHNAKLSRVVPSAESRAAGADNMLRWFDSERTYLRRLAWFENSCRAVGFVVLGYEFWVVTRNVVIALFVGAVYPATAYLGLSRGSDAGTIKKLELEKREIEDLIKG